MGAGSVEPGYCARRKADRPCPPVVDLQQRRSAIPIITLVEPVVETCVAELLDHLTIARAHFAGRSLADLQGFIATHPERIASLTLVCPTVLNPRSLAPLGARLLVVTGDHGLGARRVRAVLPDLPEATVLVLDDYAGLTWADLAADRGESIDAAMRELHPLHDALPAAGLREQEGEIAGVSFRVRGAGPPLVLLPLDLSPGQWEPLIPALSARYCTISLGGPLFSSVASLEERGRSGYMTVVRLLCRGRAGIRAHRALPAADPRRTDPGRSRRVASGRRGCRARRNLLHRPALSLRRRHQAQLTRRSRALLCSRTLAGSASKKKSGSHDSPLEQAGFEL